MKQTYTSKKTSLKQIPAVIKNLVIDEYMTILDYGCGKYDLTKEYVESFGATYYGYDKYNRTEEENKLALACKPDIIVCANVLNVIKEDEVIEEIINHMLTFKCDILFSVYEGNKTGEGKPTTRGYQRNEKAVNYIEKFLKDKFNDIYRIKNEIYCTYQK